jgi:dihydrofolate synthase / folylpolyglutamate synthase
MDAYSETLHRIYNLRGGEIDLRLDRMNHALSLFDHPEKKIRSFHIAGTNGKGSTAAMLQRILSLAGYRTALYTSPHLVSFTERIRIGDQEIHRDKVVALAEEITERTAAAEVPLTFFEFITVMAFIYFARQQAEVGVIEVGLGGRLDATNLVDPVISLITTISKDHEAYLGSDLLSIAREKGGIIKPRVPVVCGALPTEVSRLFKKLAEDQGSPSYFLGSDFSFSLKNNGLFDYTGIKQYLPELVLALRGRHQRANAAVVLAALELTSRNFPVSEMAVREGLKTVTWPGRFEIMCESPTVILDGAHNGEGVKALVEEIAEFGQGKNVKFLFASMEDKDWRLMLDALATVADEMVLTRVDMERSADPRQLANYLAEKVPHRVIEDSRTALRTLVKGARPDEVIVVAGSLYLLGEIRLALQEIVSAKLAVPQ